MKVNPRRLFLSFCLLGLLCEAEKERDLLLWATGTRGSGDELLTGQGESDVILHFEGRLPHLDLILHKLQFVVGSRA